ncbi:MAG: PQQ-binding-like beta-propeller repeat protein [Thaumarchaeota archaeon]|nr:PQQ-binding-like beta-propeller repeat protein [Nitrososphaerota archaeon]
MARLLLLSSLVVMSMLLMTSLSAVYAQAQSVPGANWEMVNYGPNGGSSSPQTQITKENVQYLETKWIYPYTRNPNPGKIGTTTVGTTSAPLIVDGVVYVSMNDRRVLAIDATTGKFLWNNSFGSNFFDRAKILATYPWISSVGGHIHAMSYFREKGWLMSSSNSCGTYAIDAKTGKTVWSIGQELMCGTNAEFGEPLKGIIGSLGNQGYVNGHAHPPVFLGNIMFIPIGGGSGNGGRAFVTAFDVSDTSNIKRLYREFIMPPAQGDPNWAIDLCTKVGGNGWYFEYPKYLEGINHPRRDREPTYLATKCTDAPADVVRNDWMDMVPSSPSFGKMHSASATSPVWGHYPLDPETGIVYMGWGDEGPYTNLTHRYGPGVPGSGFTAHDVRTGKMIWWFDAVVRDLWDYDCSWGGIFAKTSAGQKVFIKGCKAGVIFALDAATGKPVWIHDPPSIIRNLGTNYGVDKDNNPNGKDACCRLTKEDMGKPWYHYPSKEARITTSCFTSCLESDIAFDGKKVYVASFNEPRTKTITNVRPFGNQGQDERQWQNPQWADKLNTDIIAIDINTGKEVWKYHIDKVGYRGALTVAGGLVMAYASDGNLKFIDAETGKLVNEKFFGIPVNVQPTIGATKEGKMRVLVYVGGGQTTYFGNGLGLDGSLIAFGVPDALPQPQVVTKEVIKEVPKEVIKEVPKEVVREVTVETVSPISYAVIGIGIVIAVIGVVLSRRRKAS